MLASFDVALDTARDLPLRLMQRRTARAQLPSTVQTRDTEIESLKGHIDETYNEELVAARRLLMSYGWNVGERGALTASGRRFTVIAERCSGSSGYIETVKFKDDESEIEIAHDDLVTSARRLTEAEEKC